MLNETNVFQTLVAMIATSIINNANLMLNFLPTRMTDLNIPCRDIFAIVNLKRVDMYDAEDTQLV
jgi:hypothetical protein